MKKDLTKAIFLDYQIRSMNLLLERLLPNILADIDCDAAEFYILRAHWQKRVLRFVEILAHSDLTESAAQEAIDKLVKKKLLLPIREDLSKKTASYKLTALGSQFRETVQLKYADFLSHTYTGVSEPDIEQALGVIMKLHENIQAYPVTVPNKDSVISIF